MIAKEELYMCFDTNLKWYLLKNGCHFLLIANSCKSNDTFWLFEKDELFENLIKQYKQEKYK